MSSCGIAGEFRRLPALIENPVAFALISLRKLLCLPFCTYPRFQAGKRENLITRLAGIFFALANLHLVQTLVLYVYDCVLLLSLSKGVRLFVIT